MLIRFPWAWPVLVDLYRSEDKDRKRRRPHRTPVQSMATLLRVLPLWFPDRRFVFVGDSASARTNWPGSFNAIGLS